MQHAFKGDADAMRLVDDIRKVSHVWDDVFDQDKPLTREQIGNAFFAAMVGIPQNPFYIRHAEALRPVMLMGVMNWRIANAFERGLYEERVLAHVLRYSIADVATLMAFLIGGEEWADAVGPELRRRSQKDTLKNYLAELEAKNGRVQ
jgi:hypothetical protein